MRALRTTQATELGNPPSMATTRTTLNRPLFTGVTGVSALRRQPAQVHVIEQSHQRCAALGLTRIERPDHEPLIRSDLAVARERNQRLYQHAAPVMEMLFEQIVNTESMIVLTDANGTILHSVGDDDFLERAAKVALAPGVNWAEQSKGTNAVGTALFEERATLVHADEHFMHANSFLTCSAVPIFDPRGKMLGVLDVSGDHRSYHQHTMGLVRMSARMIENHWLSDDYSDRLRLHFHSRPEFIGTLLEGIVVVSADGKILGANRSALDQLAMTGVALRAQTLASLFDTSVAALHDHFRKPLPVPMRVQLHGGPQFHLSARFDWAMRAFPRNTSTPFLAGGQRPLHELAVQTPRIPVQASPSPAGLDYLLTGDAQVDTLVQKVKRIIDRDVPLLILGEPGTGKELLARAFHQDSNRAKQPFVAVRCAAMPAPQLEAELFGSQIGQRKGVRHQGEVGSFVQASGGTLFFDEIADLPLVLQAPLLQVLTQRRVSVPGATKGIAVDLAVICATRRDLRALIDSGQFSEDLYFRLNGLVVRMPALRERTDLAALAQRVLRAQNPQGAAEICPSLLARFERHPWPGNLRQLTNVLRTASLVAGDEAQITAAHLSDDLLEDMKRVAAEAAEPFQTSTATAVADDDGSTESAPPITAGESPPTVMATERTLQELEVEAINKVLVATDGNISEASKRLGISRNTIYRKLRWNRAG